CAGGLKQSAAADDDLRAEVGAVVVEGDRVASGEAHRAVVGQGHGRAVARHRPDGHGDAGSDGDGAPLADGESAGEDIAEVDRVLGADGVEGHRLAAADGVRQNVDVLEPQVVAPGAGQELDVDGGDEQRRVEGVS